MSKLTDFKYAVWAAENVMGWTAQVGRREAFWLDAPDHAACRVENWSPRTNANDALAMLEAWCDQGGDLPNERFVTITFDRVGYLVDIGKGIVIGKTLAAAICDAVYSAVEGGET